MLQNILREYLQKKVSLQHKKKFTTYISQEIYTTVHNMLKNSREVIIFFFPLDLHNNSLDIYLHSFIKTQ